LGREQKYNFRMYDVAAVFRLPWAWSLGATGLGLETRLLTSAGALVSAGDSGLIATVVPDLALTAWNGRVSLDIGGRAGLFSRQTFGNQDFGGPFQFIATTRKANT
jgi:hypothetical protein